ncbi:Lar family restriction alleviation protein [Pectobacterium sp. B2J-2]|uniref:Lar family restriction alleviation protein n=1 Tax=Pectobacterium sp. B2J-2 TaxID=3385372 RepID=UPI0038FC3056
MKIKGLEIYGEPGQFAGSFDDDGTHAGFELKPCPFCGSKANLELCNTWTPYFWVECECGAEARLVDTDNDAAHKAATAEIALGLYEKAMGDAVNAWNTRAGVRD